MKRTLGVACALCVVFQLIVFVHVICELRIGFIYIHSFMHLTVRGAESKLRKYKFYAITRRRSIHRQKYKDPF